MNTKNQRRLGAAMTVAGAAVLASLLPMTSAQAAPIEHSRYDSAESWVDDEFCGDLEVRFDFHDRGVLLIKQRGPERIPTYTVTHHGGGTITNLATDKAFTIGWHYLEQEVKVADNGDGTHTVLAQVPGPEVFYGPDGQRLFVSGGMYRVELIVDQAGTPADPSDDFVIGEEFVGDFGGQPQPPWNFCESFRALTG
jgi:hypothetical protein